MTRLALMVWLATWALGCSTTLVWYGHSPDRRRRVEVRAVGTEQHVVVDGQRGERFGAIAFEATVFSRDSAHLAYAAKSKRGWHVVRDQRRGPAHDGIATLLWSPDGKHLAYVAQDKGSWRVVRDGRDGPVFRAILEASLRFSPDSAHLAYVAQRDSGLTVVRDDQPGAIYDGVASLRFLANGQLAYVGRRRHQSYMVHAGQLSEAYDGIGEVVVQGNRLAYAAYRSPFWFAVNGALRSGPYRRVDALSMSAQGKLAYVARRKGREIVVSGEHESEPYAKVIHDSLVFSPQGKLAYGAWPLLGATGGRRQVHVYFDGKPGPGFNLVERPVFASASRQWGYIATRPDGMVVVMDGQPSRPYAWASDLVISPDGKRHGYLAREATGQHMVVFDRARSNFDLVVGCSLTLDRSGAHWACLVGSRQAKRFFYAVDGAIRRAFDMRELSAAAARAPAHRRLAKPLDSSVIREWVAAELALALSPPVSRSAAIRSGP